MLPLDSPPKRGKGTMIRMIAVVICACISLVLLDSCSNGAETINEKRARRTTEIGADLKAQGIHSSFFRSSRTWLQIEDNQWIVSVPRLEVRYYSWPFGPFHILDVLSGKWRFEE